MTGGIVASMLFVGAILVALFYFDLDDEVRRLLEWLDAQGMWAPLLFVLVMAVVVVLLLPGALFTTGAGFVFGVVEGSVYVVIGTTLGAVIAFFIARRLFGERAARYVLKHRKLWLVHDRLASEGWKIVLLIRLVPFFPSKLANYFFGLTSVSLRGFVAGTFLGIIPFSVNSAYLGAIAAQVATAGARTGGSGHGPWLLYGAGFAVALAGLIYLSRMAWRVLSEDEYTGEDNQCRG